MGVGGGVRDGLRLQRTASVTVRFGAPHHAGSINQITVLARTRRRIQLLKM